MKIAILGSGIVGRVLATAFLKEGHEVTLGTRNATKAEVTKWQAENAGANVNSFEAATESADLVVLAVQGEAAESLISALKEVLGNKIVIDATNPISHTQPPVNGVLNYFTNANESLMERLQLLAPEARFVKAFNSVGNAFMYQPKFTEGRPTMFIAGNDTEAKTIVSQVLNSFGWDAEDMGKVESARPIEALCMLWCALGFNHNQWTHAFKLLKQ
jgi:predicted dinucleotide-binding enzyme